MKTKMNNSLKSLINFLILFILGAGLLFFLNSTVVQREKIVKENAPQEKKINENKKETQEAKQEIKGEEVNITTLEKKGTENEKQKNVTNNHAIEIMGPPEPDAFEFTKNKTLKDEQKIVVAEETPVKDVEEEIRPNEKSIESSELSNKTKDVLVFMGPPEPTPEQLKKMKIAQTQLELEMEKDMFKKIKEQPTPVFPKIVKVKKSKSRLIKKATITNEEYPELDSQTARDNYQKMNETGIKIQIVTSDSYVPFEN